MKRLFVIIKDGAYWRPNSRGYTYNRLEAGLYTEEEAKDTCDHPHSSCRYKPVSELFDSIEEINEIADHLERVKQQMLDQELIKAFALADKKSRYTWLSDDEKLPPFKATKRGRMEVPLNRETHEDMQAGTLFIGVWRTQAHLIMKVDRLFQAELYMYEVGVEAVKHRVIAQMIDPDNANVLWQAIDEMSMYVMTLDAEKNTEWDVNRCKAVVRV